MVQGAIEPDRIFQAATSREPPPANSLSKYGACRDKYYSNRPDRTYWVGCSTDGRHFPQLSVNDG